MDDAYLFEVFRHLLEKIAVGLPPSLEFRVSLVSKGGIRRCKCLHLIQDNRFVAVEEKLRRDFIGVQGGNYLFHDFDIGNGAGDNRYIIRIDKLLCAQPPGILEKQLHGLLSGQTSPALQHVLFIERQHNHH